MRVQTALRWLAIAPIFLAARPACAAQVGYINRLFHAGTNLFHSGLDGLNNHLSSLIPGPPENTAVSLWNPSANAFDATSVFSGSAWSIDFDLPPGTGARLVTSARFMATFVGEVLNHDGSPINADNPIPPPFSSPDGLYLLGDKSPMASTGTDVFLNIVGRMPNIGEQITRLDATNQVYITSTYLGDGAWDIEPSISWCEAVFFRLASGLTNDGWQLWIQAAGLTGNHALPSAAPYGDGIPNALKYAFNMNGSGPDDRRLTPGTGVSGLPVLWLDRQGPAPVARFEFVRRKNGDVTYTPKQSTTLSSGSWTPMAGTPSVTAIDSEWERVSIETPADALQTPVCFFAVEVALP